MIVDKYYVIRKPGTNDRWLICGSRNPELVIASVDDKAQALKIALKLNELYGLFVQEFNR